MGKQLIQQRRGKGSSRFRAPSFRYAGTAGLARQEQTKSVTGRIIDILHSSGHSAPLMEMKYSNGEKGLLQAPEGIKVGDQIEMGENVEIKVGNVLPLKNIPEGTSIYNIESYPGDGGKFVKANGTFARVVTKMEEGIVIELPSAKRRTFLPNCRAVVGVVAGAGKREKPFLKAGTRMFAMKAKNKFWPQVSGTSMNAVSHPFGGRSSHAKGVPTQSPRNAPPGAKVGKIAPKKTGRGGKK